MSEPLFHFKSHLQLANNQPSLKSNWVCPGFLARGNLTLLTSQWKSGKTTLLSILLSHLDRGSVFLGKQLTPTRSVILSEESEAHWRDRTEKLNFGSHLTWLCRPFASQPTYESWLALIDSLVQLYSVQPFDLLAIDPLASFLPPHAENQSSSIVKFLLSLQPLIQRNVAILILHHPRKGETLPGQSARGSGALGSHVDILLEMNSLGLPHEDDRRRRILASSRYPETPRRTLIELNAEGTDYLQLDDAMLENQCADWPVLIGVLEDAHQKFTRGHILAAWPNDFAKPKDSTLWRWLSLGVQRGEILQSGTGRRNSPFKYWLPGQEKRWENDPFHLPELPPLPEWLNEPSEDFLKNAQKEAEMVLNRKKGATK